MSLLDDAQELPKRRIHEYRGNGLYSCVLCGWGATRAELDQPDMTLVHTTDCPWLSMPKIVATLEAADRLAAEPPEADGPWCAVCGAAIREWRREADGSDTKINLPHEPDCDWQALKSALSGTLVPSTSSIDSESGTTVD